MLAIRCYDRFTSSGALLDEIGTLGLVDSTAVIVHGDHGWHLGELGEFRKFTNFELATRVPLIIRAPWLTMTPRYSGLVELVDMLPTMAELAGVRQLRHHLGPSLRDIWALYHPTHAVYCALLGYPAYWMLVGACDPIL